MSITCKDGIIYFNNLIDHKTKKVVFKPLPEGVTFKEWTESVKYISDRATKLAKASLAVAKNK